MKRFYFVDHEMCGAGLPPDFDLEEFCECLQGKVTDFEIVPVTEPEAGVVNLDHSLVSESVFLEALGEYCPR